MLNKQRTGRLMRRNDATYLPTNVIAFDTETKPEPMAGKSTRLSHTFRLGHYVYSRYRRGNFGSLQSRAFISTHEFWDALDNHSSPRHTLWAIAHSALFDLVTCGLREVLESGRYTLDAPRSPRKEPQTGSEGKSGRVLLAIDGQPFLLCLRSAASGGRILFVDTLNWFRSTLKEIGDQIGLAKLDMPQFDASDDEWRVYCERDTMVCFRAFCGLVEWQKSNDLGVFRYTAPSQAMSAFRHRLQPSPIFVHDNAECKGMERNAFFGGRTECFRIGAIDEQVYQYDVNSLYPSVMRDNQFPYMLDCFEDCAEPKMPPSDLPWPNCVAECDLVDAPPIYPLRHDDLIVYPRGQFRTTLCGPELHHAVTSGHVATIGRYAVYKMAPLFTAYVDYFWDMRQRYKSEGNQVYANLAKIMLNSLFGKFAQRQFRWRQCDDRIGGLSLTQWIEGSSLGGKPQMFRCVGGVVFAEQNEGERDDTFVAISAFVASYGRVKMNTLRHIAGRENVFYQGVDSLLLSSDGRARLAAASQVCDVSLGKLRCNYHASSAHVYNCSDYRIGTKAVVAGKSRKSHLDASGRMMASTMNAIDSLFDAGGGNAMIEKISEWRRTNVYRKGSVERSGWVEPLYL